MAGQLTVAPGRESLWSDEMRILPLERPAQLAHACLILSLSKDPSARRTRMSKALFFNGFPSTRPALENILRQAQDEAFVKTEPDVTKAMPHTRATVQMSPAWEYRRWRLVPKTRNTGSSGQLQ